QYVAPVTDLEIELVKIWQEVLGVETIGITDNFFELGGHSLSATVVINKIMKSLNIEISLRDFLFKNDIRGIAEVISEREWLTTEVSFKNEIII
ncbi:hypothetical protein KHA90_24670, partial [Flavobacterium psychroterrae]